MTRSLRSRPNPGAKLRHFSRSERKAFAAKAAETSNYNGEHLTKPSSQRNR